MSQKYLLNGNDVGALKEDAYELMVINFRRHIPSYADDFEEEG